MRRQRPRRRVLRAIQQGPRRRRGHREGARRQDRRGLDRFDRHAQVLPEGARGHGRRRAQPLRRGRFRRWRHKHGERPALAPQGVPRAVPRRGDAQAAALPRLVLLPRAVPQVGCRQAGGHVR